MGEIVIRELCEDDWGVWRELRLAALEEAPYAFGSKLSDWTGAGDVPERWRNRLAQVAFNAVAELHGEQAGMVSGSEPEGGEVMLLSMWVAPLARGCGVGEALVGAVVDWAAGRGASRVALDVRVGNDKAIALYERCGFADAGWAGGPEDPHPERRMTRELQA